MIQQIIDNIINKCLKEIHLNFENNKSFVNEHEAAMTINLFSENLSKDLIFNKGEHFLELSYDLCIKVLEILIIEEYKRAIINGEDNEEELDTDNEEESNINNISFLNPNKDMDREF